ncbi:MAG: single-stranded DNA-binding protein [Firmicutes bacterium]|nr:single-stranded DNA-binding protein [Bacillota bacterium]
MNRICLIGNLTRDPEASTIPSGIKVCKFTIAVNRSFSNADGTRQADFIPVVCWRNSAENCAKFLKKGSKVGVTGSLQIRTFDAQDGTKRYVAEVQADEVQFLSTKNDSDSQDYGGGFDDVQTLPEATQAKKIETLKPIADDGDLPF